MAETSEVSLKGGGGLWGGLTDSSAQEPTEGRFFELEGCVLSRDGTEIRGFPGTGTVAKPGYYGWPFRIRTVSVGTQTAISFTPMSRDGGMPASGKTTVYIEGLGVDLPDGEYTADRKGANVVWVDKDTTGKTITFTDASIRIKMGTKVHRIGWAEGYPVAVGESTFWDVDGTKKKRAVATWVGDKPMDLANVQAAWEYWGCPSNDSKVFNAPGQTLNEHFDFRPRYRVGINEAGGHLIIPVPGYGVVLSCYLEGKKLQADKTTNWTKAIAPPKAAFDDDTFIVKVTKFTAEEAKAEPKAPKIVSTTQTMLRIAYRDRATGKLGLVSRGLYVNVGAFTNQKVVAKITIRAKHPRFLIAEGADYSIIVYTTFSAIDAGYYPIHEQTVRNQDRTPVEIDIFDLTEKISWIAGDDLGSWVEFPLVPQLEQAPMGASFATTLRGTTFYGGALAQSSDGVVTPGAPPHYDSNNHKETLTAYVFQTLDFSTPTTETLPALYFLQPADVKTGNRRAGDHLTGALAADFRLPASYQGMELQFPIDPATTPGEGGNTQSWRLGELHYGHRYLVEGKVPFALREQFVKLSAVLPRGQMWFSEQGFPAATPSINRVFFDRLKGVDLRCVAKMGDTLVACSDQETYMLSWGRSPLGASPSLISSTRGCIAPHSMVEFPGGVAWLSKDGPVVARGPSLQWVGRAIQDRWQSRYLMDSEGSMWHAWGVYDPDSESILWGLRADVNTTAFASAADNLDKAVASCDELLAFHLPTQSFSTHQPSGDGFRDAALMQGVNGKQRLTLLRDSEEIVQTVDGYADSLQSTVTYTSTAIGAASLFFVVNQDFSAVPDGTHGIIKDTAGTVITAGKTSNAQNGAIKINGTVTSWEKGSTLELYLNRMVLETTYLRHTEMRLRHRVQACHLYYTMVVSTGTASGIVRCEVVTPDGTKESFQGASFAKALDPTKHVIRFDEGFVDNLEDSRLRFTIYANCQVRIKDITVSVGRGG